MAEIAQPTSFPRQLLHQSLQARLDYFKGYTVAHPALKQADQAVWNALDRPGGQCHHRSALLQAQRSL